jgi:uncharacterized membrane protein
MKIKKSILLVVLFFCTLLIFSNKSYAGTQSWNSLNYDATINSDGSVNVVETWNISISETNTLFKDFELDSSKYSSITDVNVSRVYSNNLEKSLTQIYEEQYHVDNGCFYALNIDSSTFEIAWNVGLDSSSDTRTYKLYYTIQDAIKVYNDCTEFYWQFLGTDNSISGKNITGTITLPKAVSDIENLRVWAHGPLTGKIQKISTNQVYFEIPSLSSGNMVEVRIVSEESICSDSINRVHTDMLSSILKEEQKWANEANLKRNALKIVLIIALSAEMGIVLLLISKIVKYLKARKKLYAYQYPKSDLEYFRDIPNEKEATPTRAAYLYYFKNNTSSSEQHISKIFSATILDLALKGMVQLELVNKKNVKIIIVAEKIENAETELTSDENVVYKLLKKASGTKGYVTTEELIAFGKKEYEYFHSYTKNLKSAGEIYVKNKYFDSDRKEEIDYWNKKNGNYLGLLFLMIFVSMFFLPLFIIFAPILIGLEACYLVCRKNANIISILTEEGNEEVNQWRGLKNYMSDFSLLKDKEVPDLILWEKYLVYATTFGISKKVIEQLKTVYPEMINSDYYDNSYAYLHLMCHSNFENNFIDDFNNQIGKVCYSATNAYNVAHSSSSSGRGGGGGFSSGGGGRRRWWPVAVDVKIFIT